MSVMFKNSVREDQAHGYGFGVYRITGKNVLSLRDDSNAHNVEWHHCAGHSSGREVISFYPSNSEQVEAVSRLRLLVEEDKGRLKRDRDSLKSRGLPTSKAALWRHLSANGLKDCGYGEIDAKSGKYGWFRCERGTPDTVFYFDSAEIAKLAEEKL
tara:strand:+ start:353 stop:820 length:468 start_codon:yes stop_codon:yes gene_type:complete